jgi:hypothetical protein
MEGCDFLGRHAELSWRGWWIERMDGGLVMDGGEVGLSSRPQSQH